MKPRCDVLKMRSQHPKTPGKGGLLHHYNTAAVDLP